MTKTGVYERMKEREGGNASGITAEEDSFASSAANPRSAKPPGTAAHDHAFTLLTLPQNLIEQLIASPPEAEEVVTNKGERPRTGVYLRSH